MLCRGDDDDMDYPDGSKAVDSIDSMFGLR